MPEGNGSVADAPATDGQVDMLYWLKLRDIVFDFSKANGKPTIYLAFEDTGESKTVGLYTTEETWERDLEHWKGRIGDSLLLREVWTADHRHRPWLQLDRRVHPTSRAKTRPHYPNYPNDLRPRR